MTIPADLPLQIRHSTHRCSPRTPSLVVKRSVVVARQKTSVSLEDGFWTELRRFAREDGIRLTDIIGEIDAGRRNKANLSGSIRLYVLDRLKRENAAPMATV